MSNMTDQFKNASKKAVILLGMSGAGKTHISSLLQDWGWDVYSCDFEIGDKYLSDEIGCEGKFTMDDISLLSDYLGKIGDPEKGGFTLEKFKARQKAYYDAEIASLYAAVDIVGAAKGHFVLDTTGSLCELEDEKLMKKLGEKAVFVYLKAGEEAEKAVLQRAQDYPKPLFYPSAFLTEKLDEFLSENDLGNTDEIDPDDFSRWVFPKLYEARKPKYQKLADKYGVSIDSDEFKDLKSSSEFIEILEHYIDEYFEAA